MKNCSLKKSQLQSRQKNKTIQRNVKCYKKKPRILIVNKTRADLMKRRTEKGPNEHLEQRSAEWKFSKGFKQNRTKSE